MLYFHFVLALYLCVVSTVFSRVLRVAGMMGISLGVHSTGFISPLSALIRYA